MKLLLGQVAGGRKPPPPAEAVLVSAIHGVAPSANPLVAMPGGVSVGDVILFFGRGGLATAPTVNSGGWTTGTISGGGGNAGYSAIVATSAEASATLVQLACSTGAEYVFVVLTNVSAFNATTIDSQGAVTTLSLSGLTKDPFSKAVVSMAVIDTAATITPPSGSVVDDATTTIATARFTPLSGYVNGTTIDWNFSGARNACGVVFELT